MPEAIDEAKPAIDGWFATDDAGLPHLIGSKCAQCGTYVFPPRANNCPNPACDGDELEQVALSRRGKVWSYTENRYPPPAPYPAPDPFEPFAIAAVELADEGLIVLGKVVEGTLAADLNVGMEMELTTDAAIHRRRRCRPHRLRVEDRMSPEPVYILGAGMHPWGKWGTDFTEYGVVAARAALAEAGLDWRQIQMVAGRRHHPQRLPGLHRRIDVRAEAGLERGAGQLELRGVCERFAGAAERAGPDPGRVLRRRLGHRRRHDPERGFRAGRRGTQERSGLAAVPPDRRDEPRVLRPAGAPPDGPLRCDAGGLRPGEGQELPARPAEPECPLPQGVCGRGRAHQPGGRRPAATAGHLRDVRRCRGADRREQVRSPRSTSVRSKACRRCVPSAR